MDVPESARPFSCKWIFKRKLPPDGTINRKVQGKTTGKRFLSERRYCLLRYLCTSLHNYYHHGADCWVDIKKFIIHQMDVKTIFLNGDLTKEITWRDQGLDALKNKICKFIKSLCSLKCRSPRGG